MNKIVNNAGKPSYKFYELSIWKQGYDLLMEVYNLTEKYPSEEKYAITSQLRRSANSVIANIAEAHGRYHYADKIRVLYISRGEIQETQSHLSVAWGRKYITLQEFQNLSRSYENLKVGINNYINSLYNKKKKSKNY